MGPPKKEKTGQSIDNLKTLVTIPEVTNTILEISNSKDLSILEIGPGDGKSFKHMIDILKKNSVEVSHMTLAETDYTIWGYLAEEIILPIDTDECSITFTDPNILSMFGPSIITYEDFFDITNIQMVFHQMGNPALRSLYLARSFIALKDNGALLLTDLHPEYYKFLDRETPDKFSSINDVGTYMFDSGGEIKVYILKIEEILATALAMGFKFNSIKNHDLTPALGLKPRYSELIEKDIPMTYTLSLIKDADNFLSYSEGIIKSTKREGQYIIVTFDDDSERQVPFSTDIDLKVGHVIIIHQALHPVKKEAVITNVWSHKLHDMISLKYYQSVAKLRIS